MRIAIRLRQIDPSASRWAPRVDGFLRWGALALILAGITACQVGVEPEASGLGTPIMRGTAERAPVSTASQPPDPVTAGQTAGGEADPSATVPFETTPAPSADWSEFDSQQAHAFVAEQLSFGPRIPGSPGHAQVISWISAELESAGWPVELQRFSYQGVALTNIIAAAPGGADPWIILGAHFDTRPVADRDSAEPGQPVPGANDGASGVAVLLGLAHALPAGSLPCEVWLAFFDAEDSGGISGWEWFVGSRYMAENLPGEPEAVIIVDMVGDADLQLYLERNSDPELSASIWETGAELGQESFILQPKHTIQDDHIPFLRRGIPAVDIIDFDYPYWHTTEDTLDKISARSLHQVGVTLRTWLSRQCKSSD